MAAAYFGHASVLDSYYVGPALFFISGVSFSCNRSYSNMYIL